MSGSVKLNLQKEEPTVWPDRLWNCEPFLVRPKPVSDTDYIKESVVIRLSDEYLFLDQAGLSYTPDPMWIRENYNFIRYLGPEESLVITGREFK